MNERNNGYSSPACYLHELQENEQLSVADDVASWRSKERKRLLALRRSVGQRERRSRDAAIAGFLDQYLATLVTPDGLPIIAVYWPIRGEPDLRDWYAAVSGRGATLALPVVVARNEALSFRCWQPGSDLQADLLGIPAPAAGADVEPEIVIAPFVGFDQEGYRLGNGGGYYDRSLAEFSSRPQLIAVGDSCGALRSIYPRQHDIPMDAVITEHAIHRFAGQDSGIV